MLNSSRSAFFLRFGRWMCTCQPDSSMSDALIRSIRPWRLGSLAFWCDKSEAVRQPQ